jgi:LPXTG-motif cell wall-anchored protein
MASACLALVATVTTASAQTQPTHLGFPPFPGASADSGTCGNDWANDTFTRVFTATVTPSESGPPTVILHEAFVDGKFTTVEGKSPGACNGGSGSDNGATVKAGVKGTFSGFLEGPLTDFNLPGDTAPKIDCPPPNTTDCFVKAIFGPDAVFTPDKFKFNYLADCGQELVANMWQNADESNGGNTGDIASVAGDETATVTPCPTPTPTPRPTPRPTPKVTPTPTSQAVTLANTGGGTPILPIAGLILIALGGIALALRRRTN